MTRRDFLRLTAGAFLAVASSTPAHAAPKADPWPRWRADTPGSPKTVDHGAWTRFLERFLVMGDDGINRLRYAGVDRDGEDMLHGYLIALAAVRPADLRRVEQMPYWINLYNALTVRVVLDHYPVSSIREIDISPGWFSDGPWGARLVTVDGVGLSLDDIEHRILRPIWRDPRIHYAVNCASLGCPNLQPVAYTARTCAAMLDAGARAYVNHPRGVTPLESGRLRVSSLYKWYRSDFGGSDAGVLDHLRHYAEPSLAEHLGRGAEIVDHAYDWRLNDADGSG
jgi:hypothetical protein